MKKEQKIFSLIVKNSVFAFLKEKYPDYQFDDKDDENIVKITNLLKQLEEYAHIPDKMSTIKKDYETTKKYMDNGTFREVEFLEFLQNESKELTEDEKNSILNAVIFVTNEDKNISDTEKEIILQIAKFLDINHSYKDILKNYDKSEFSMEEEQNNIKTSFNIKIFIQIILSLIMVVAISWFIINKVNVGNTKISIEHEGYNDIDKLFTSFLYVPIIDYKDGYTKTDRLVHAYIFTNNEDKVIKGFCKREFDVSIGYDNLSNLITKYHGSVCKNREFDLTSLPEPDITTTNSISIESNGKYTQEECEKLYMIKDGNYMKGDKEQMLEKLKKDGTWEKTVNTSQEILLSFIKITCVNKGVN